MQRGGAGGGVKGERRRKEGREEKEKFNSGVAEYKIEFLSWSVVLSCLL